MTDLWLTPTVVVPPVTEQMPEPNYASGAGVMSTAEMAEFHDGIAEALAPLMGHRISPSLLDQGQCYVRHQFAQLEAAGRILLIADGLRVVDGFLRESRHDGGLVDVLFRTEFYPAPRYPNIDGDYIALGFFEDYDLWLARQDPLPPTLIARYGSAAGHYFSTNPYLLSPEQLDRARVPWLQEALRRARQLMLLDDPRWDRFKAP